MSIVQGNRGERRLRGGGEFVVEYLAPLEWRVRTMAPDAPRPETFLVAKHYLRKHGPGAYYGQK